jgi:hypothetical protein
VTADFELLFDANPRPMFVFSRETLEITEPRIEVPSVASALRILVIDDEAQVGRAVDGLLSPEREHLQKPFSEDQLRSTIARIVQND